MQGLPITLVTYSRNPIRPQGPLGAGIPSHTHQPDWIGQCDGDDHHHHHHFVPREVANNEISGAKKFSLVGELMPTCSMEVQVQSLPKLKDNIYKDH